MRPELAISSVALAAALLAAAPFAARANAQDSTESGAEFERAAQLMAQGQRDQAYPHLVRLTDQRAPFPEAYLFRGSIERERGELTHAEEAFLRGLEVISARVSEARQQKLLRGYPE